MKLITVGILMLLALFSPFKNQQKMYVVKTFVLVHGAWQAPYAWQAVKDQLEKKGHKVIVIELPGHGADQTPPIQASIDSYSQKVIEAIDAVDSKVILVGHSMAGLVVSEVAEKIPAKIDKLVYIGAYVPANGQSLMELSMLDKQSLLGASLIPSQDQLTLDVKKENLTNIFCQDATKEEKDLVLANYRSEPAIPFTNKVTVTVENFGKVNKYYIRTVEDHAVGISLQDQMLKAANITHVFSVKTGHCPFISQPGEITSILNKL